MMSGQSSSEAEYSSRGSSEESHRHEESSDLQSEGYSDMPPLERIGSNESDADTVALPEGQEPDSDSLGPPPVIKIGQRDPRSEGPVVMKKVHDILTIRCLQQSRQMRMLQALDIVAEEIKKWGAQWCIQTGRKLRRNPVLKRQLRISGRQIRNAQIRETHAFANTLDDYNQQVFWRQEERRVDEFERRERDQDLDDEEE